MAGAQILSYKERDSVIHGLTGTAKLVFFLLWSIAAMITYDTRVLLGMLAAGLVFFFMSRIRLREVSFALGFMFGLILVNAAALYFFEPEHGVMLYGTRHELFSLSPIYSVTLEQLFYMFNFMMKYFSVIPVALLFILTTNPSEFAASLNRIGVSYRVSYAVALALRYIPDIRRDYRGISQAQQARGIDLSRNEKLLRRLKNTAVLLLPLLLSSLQRIETISNAMELRGFGKHSSRTWYAGQPYRFRDAFAMILGAVSVTVSVLVMVWNGGRFYNPF